MNIYSHWRTEGFSPFNPGCPRGMVTGLYRYKRPCFQGLPPYRTVPSQTRACCSTPPTGTPLLHFPLLCWHELTNEFHGRATLGIIIPPFMIFSPYYLLLLSFLVSKLYPSWYCMDLGMFQIIGVVSIVSVISDVSHKKGRKDVLLGILSWDHKSFIGDWCSSDYFEMAFNYGKKIEILLVVNAEAGLSVKTVKMVRRSMFSIRERHYVRKVLRIECVVSWNKNSKQPKIST